MQDHSLVVRDSLLLWLLQTEKSDWNYRDQGYFCCSKPKHLTLGKYDSPLQPFTALSQEEGRGGSLSAKPEMK